MPDRAADITTIVTGGRARGLSDDQIKALVVRYDERQQATQLPAKATAGMKPQSTAAGDPQEPRGQVGQAVYTALAPVRAWGEAGPHQVVEGIKDVGRGEYARGGNRMLRGGMMTALPMVAPTVARAVIANPLGAAAVAGTGMAGEAITKPTLEAAGATPDQADLGATIAGVLTGGGMQKYGLPAAGRISSVRTAKATADAYKSTVHDIQGALGVDEADVHRALPFFETLHKQGVVNIGGEDAVAQIKMAGDLAVNEIEQHVAGEIARFPNVQIPSLASRVRARIARMPGLRASDRQAAEGVIQENGLDAPMSLEEAEALRVRFNNDNDMLLSRTATKQSHAAIGDPDFVARQAAANALREEIYGALEQRGVQGIRALRRAEGSVIALRNAADPLTSGLRAESTVARTGETSLPRRVAQRVAPVLGAGGGAMVGGPAGAAVGAELGRSMTAGLTSSSLSRNALLDRAFRQSFTSPPIMSVRGPSGQMPPTGGVSRPPQPMLSGPAQRAIPAPNPRPMGPAPDTSFVRGVPGQYGERPISGALPPATRPMGPGADPSGGGGVTPRSIVVRDPRTGRFRKVYLGESK